MFVEDLTEELAHLIDEQDLECRIEFWFSNSDAQSSEQGESHSSVGDELEAVGGEIDRVVSLRDDPVVADRVVRIGPEPPEDGEDIGEGVPLLPSLAQTRVIQTGSNYRRHRRARLRCGLKCRSGRLC